MTSRKDTATLAVGKSMSTSKNECLMVLGMHRSGTSVLTGCLDQLGVELGRVMLPANASNETGYFEHTDLILIHDLLFRALNYRWHFVGRLPNDWLTTEAAQQAKQRILNILDNDFGNAPLWAVKEPRMCRLLPLWLEVFAKRNIEPKFVLVVRQPLEAAQSLHKRDGFDLCKGHLLWLSYNREALSNCQGFPTAVVTYDQLLAHPIQALENLSHKLDLTWPINPRTIHPQILAFVQTKLKHHNFGSIHPTEQKTFDSFAKLYDLILQQTSSTDFITKPNSDEDSDHTAATSKRLLSHNTFFPLSEYDLKLSHSVPADSAITAILDHMQDFISEYERKELAQNVLREQRLLTADHQAHLLYLQVFFPRPERIRSGIYRAAIV